MNKPSTLVSFAGVRRSAFGSMLALTLLISTRVEAAEEGVGVVRTVSPRAVTEARSDRSGWSFNATPVLVLPKNGYRWGGGADPELKYTLDLRWTRLSAGGRVGAYYAKNQFGVSLMPTVRVMVPLGAIEPYVSAGAGYGWLPDTDHADLTTMARAGFVYRFSKKVAVGIEGTHQELRRSDYRFFSVGSMMAFDL
jgi:hypothetical protein